MDALLILEAKALATLGAKIAKRLRLLPGSLASDV